MISDYRLHFAYGVNRIRERRVDGKEGQVEMELHFESSSRYLDCR